MLRCKIVAYLFFALLSLSCQVLADIPETIKAIYLPPHTVNSRRIDQFLFYAGQVGMNAAVLHVKDPFGRLIWNSDNPLARASGASAERGLEGRIQQLKAGGIWTIAKLDVFADHGLVTYDPGMGLQDVRSDTNWEDKNGLFWANPYDKRIWDYIIDLGRELATMGFNEIQFDYVRFPSDGELSAIDYPIRIAGVSRAQCIGNFLERAYGELSPLGVQISADIFGLTAWKRDDFGVGQILEKMAPHLDIICPMFYPSHFPNGFLGELSSDEYPREIMVQSMNYIKSRTDKRVRPWIQGFWYTPGEIDAQIQGVADSGTTSWAIWNPTATYDPSYQALADRMGITISNPEFYPPVAKLRRLPDKITRGNHRVINFTDYARGFTILSLEESQQGYKSRYTHPSAVIMTLDEGIMDHILAQRSVRFGPLTNLYTKTLELAALLCRDLKIDARRMRPKPIFIDWEGDCRFSASIPKRGMSLYVNAIHRKPEEQEKILLTRLKP